MGKKKRTKEEIAAVKRERFVRVAEQRTQKVIDDLRALGKCAAPEIYVFDEADAKQILDAIEVEVQKVRDAFAGRDRFSLSE